MAFIRVESSTPSRDNVQFKISAVDGETSDWYIVPAGTLEVGVDLIPAGSARIETTNNIDGVVGNTGASVVTPIVWDPGVVSSAVSQTAIKTRAFRVVSVSGVAEAFFDGAIA